MSTGVSWNRSHLFLGKADTEENRKGFIATVPLGRGSTPGDIANACTYLASDEANFITGVNLEVRPFVLTIPLQSCLLIKIGHRWMEVVASESAVELHSLVASKVKAIFHVDLCLYLPAFLSCSGMRTTHGQVCIGFRPQSSNRHLASQRAPVFTISSSGTS